MSVRPLVYWPDPRLAQPSAMMERYDVALYTLANDLLDTMRAAPGVGATAAHMGVLTRLFVIELPEDPAPRFYVNAEILSASAESQVNMEGSISMPGARAEISRAASVRVRWRDLDGGEHEEAVAGFRAACIQHEIDQMDGVFWLQRLSKLKRDRVIARWRKEDRQRGGHNP